MKRTDGHSETRKRVIGGAAAASMVLCLAAAQPAIASTGSAPAPASAKHAAADQQPPTLAEVEFAHPVSLRTAASVKSVAGVKVLGYHFVSDSIVGDYFPDGALSLDDFLADVSSKTGTAPEVVSAYIPGEAAGTVAKARESAEAIGASLPAYDSPDADPAPAFIGMTHKPPASEQRATVSTLASTDTWQPNDAEAMITPLGSSKISIVAKYSWWSTSPFASPLVMANHWGMEFQFDFYTTTHPIVGPGAPPNLGYRPYCGTLTDVYKDWAVASTRPYTWVAMVTAGANQVVAPANLGMYGDFNDLSDPCGVSTIAVGMANPWVMPSSYGSNFLSISYYPTKGQVSKNVVGSIVQPVSRTHCEQNPTMYLMDCMGVTPGAYPGPGPATSRLVLNNSRGLQAPSLCWWSGGFGLDSSQFSVWDCNQGS